MAYIHVSHFVISDHDLPSLTLRLKKECQVLGNRECMKHLGSKLWGKVSSVLKMIIFYLGIPM